MGFSVRETGVLYIFPYFIPSSLSVLWFLIIQNNSFWSLWWSNRVCSSKVFSFLIALKIPGNLIKHNHSRNADFIFILGLITNCPVSWLFNSIKLKVFTNMFSEHRCSLERNISQNLNFLLVYFMIQLPGFYRFF